MTLRLTNKACTGNMPVLQYLDLEVQAASISCHDKQCMRCFL